MRTSNFTDPSINIYISKKIAKKVVSWKVMQDFELFKKMDQDKVQEALDQNFKEVEMEHFIKKMEFKDMKRGLGK